MIRDLRLGARLALAGGRGAWARTALTAIGVGLGVALLLIAASVPHMYANLAARNAARDDFHAGTLAPSDRTLVIGLASTTYRGAEIRGRLLKPDGARPPKPPGVSHLPGNGEMVVSPSLAALLRSDEGRLLRLRIPDRIVGTIRPAGLSGPGDRAFYAGSARLVAGDVVHRIDSFGAAVAVDELDPVLTLLLVIVVVVLLAPIAVFLAAAVRFGGEQRNRRLAALRLAGADSWMVRRIAAGEALVGSALGLAAGAGFFAVARRLAPSLSLSDLSFYPGDVRPSLGLVALIAVAIPLLTVGVTVLALRGVAIDPLGIVRRGRPRRRRLAWRGAVPVLGVVLLLPALGVDAGVGESFNTAEVAAGVVLVLIGITALLPWAVETVVHRIRGGGVAWQLASRRLQLDSGTSARVVSGIAVAVAGAIALQTLFAGVRDQYTKTAGSDASAGQAYADFRPNDGLPAVPVIERRLRDAGARDVVASRSLPIGTPRIGESSLTVASCPTLRALAGVRACREGDSFVFADDTRAPRAGETVRLDNGVRWRVPSGARPIRTSAATAYGLMMTPSALRGRPIPPAGVTVNLRAPQDAEAVERLRNAAASLTPMSSISLAAGDIVNPDLIAIRRGLYAGATLVLLLIAASMVVTVLEQLSERRRLLAVLIAFGTPRRTLGRSLLVQAAIPVGIGLTLAVVLGASLGALLRGMAGVGVALDPVVIGAMTAVGAAVVPLVTVATLPALRRTMTPEGLRAE